MEVVALMEFGPSEKVMTAKMQTTYAQILAEILICILAHRSPRNVKLQAPTPGPASYCNHILIHTNSPVASAGLLDTIFT
jgi:hypothetical protein